MRLIFAGTPDFAARALTALCDAGHDISLVLCQPDRPAGRGLRLTESPVKRLAVARGLALFQPTTLKDPVAISRLDESRSELMVVAAYGLILPQAVLDITPKGAINIHASLLPRWRGAAPIQRALLAGDRKTGVTIMKMDAGLDTGPIYTQRQIDIEPHDDSGSLHEKLANLGAEMVVAALADLEIGPLEWREQPQQGAIYAHKIAKQETCVDWSRPAEEIARRLRALRPHPGLQTAFRGERIKLWQAFTKELSCDTPGTILEANASGISVACGEAGLCITELQRTGGRRLPAADFLRGLPLRQGERFDFLLAAG